MSRFLSCFLILGLALGALALAQENDPPDILKKKVRTEDPKKDPKDPKNDLKDELPELERIGDDDEGSGEDPAVIVERIKKNLAESENRLEKKDPGEDNRKIQDKIVKDLDELIKQQNDDDGGGGGGGGGGSSGRKGGQGGKGGTANKGGAGGGGGGGKGGGNKGGGNGGGGGGQNQNPNTAGGKDGQGGGGMGGKGGKKNNTIAELGKGIWGHLSETKRQEMDAYSKERFMPRYSDLLRQYYKTIAEQNSRKEGE